MTQSVKCLPDKYEGLNSDPQNPHKKLGQTSSTGEAEVGGALELDSHPDWPITEFEVQ